MSIDDYPLKAKDGMAITTTETYLKLLEITKALNEPSIMRIIINQCDIPVCDRDALREAMEHRKRMLQAVLRQQASALATMHRQSQ
jgi:CRP-like cAMP-binding protein